MIIVYYNPNPSYVLRTGDVCCVRFMSTVDPRKYDSMKRYKSAHYELAIATKIGRNDGQIKEVQFIGKRGGGPIAVSDLPGTVEAMCLSLQDEARVLAKKLKKQPYTKNMLLFKKAEDLKDAIDPNWRDRKMYKMERTYETNIDVKDKKKKKPEKTKPKQKAKRRRIGS